MRPGSLLKIRMRSAISTASSMLCETMTIPLVGMRWCVPQIEEIAAQGFGGQDVERRERLVEQQDIGIDDERAGKADALPHAAGQLLRIGILEPVEPDQIDRADRPPPPLGAGDAQRLEAELDIAEHGQPRKQRIALEHHRDAANRLGDRHAAIFDNALARRHEPGENAQKGRFAGSRFAEDRDDLAVAQREVDMVEHQPPEMIGGAIGLRDALRCAAAGRRHSERFSGDELAQSRRKRSAARS